MNFEWVNKAPQDWSKETWQERYDEYCKNNYSGPKTKKEYYDMVLENYNKRIEREKPISQELLDEWTRGRRAAKIWAKAYGCNINGESLQSVATAENNTSAIEIANGAKELAIETAQKLEYLIDVAKQRRA